MKNILWGILLLSTQLCAKTSTKVENGQLFVNTDRVSVTNAIKNCKGTELMSPFVFTLYKKSDDPEQCSLWREVKKGETKENNFHFDLDLSQGKYFVITSYLQVKQCIDSEKELGSYLSESSEIIEIQERERTLQDDINVQSSYVIYPNPVKNVLQIKSLEYSGIVDIELYSQNMELLLVRKSTFEQEEISIDLSKHENGIYFLSIVTADRTETMKFIKQ